MFPHLRISFSKHTAIVEIGTSHHNYSIIDDQQLIVDVYLISNHCFIQHSPVPETVEANVIGHRSVRDASSEFFNERFCASEIQFKKRYIRIEYKQDRQLGVV